MHHSRAVVALVLDETLSAEHLTWKGLAALGCAVASGILISLDTSPSRMVKKLGRLKISP